MKNIFIISILFTSFFSFSQNKKQDKIKALKIAYITEKLDLTTNEAENFWPIYNDFFNTKKQFRKDKRKKINQFKQMQIKDSDTVLEKKTKILLYDLQNIEKKEYLAKQKLYSSLQNILSAKKIMQLIIAEKDFNRKLLRNLKNRQKH